MLSHAEIKSLMPHRHPMLLVDAIHSLEKWTEIVGVKNVSGDEWCYARVPDQSRAQHYAYPTSLMIESFGQTGGVLINSKRRSEGAPADVVMLFAGLSGFRIMRSVYPGDTMVHHVRIEKDLVEFAVLNGEVRVGGAIVACAESIIVAYRPASQVMTASRGAAP